MKNKLYFIFFPVILLFLSNCSIEINLGDATFNLTKVPNNCGDGIQDLFEECDSGGVDSAQCNSNCTLNVCGDAYLNLTTEACDDGNTAAADGCSATCVIEPCVSYFTLEDTSYFSSYGSAPATFADVTASAGGFSGQTSDESGYSYRLMNMCSGTYYVWVLGYDIGPSPDKSYGFWDFNSMVDTTATWDWFSNETFGWTRSNAVALTAGSHTWRIGSMVDGGSFTVGWDQMIVTQNALFTPPPGPLGTPTFYDSSEEFSGWTDTSGGSLSGDTICPSPPVGSTCIHLSGGGSHTGVTKPAPANPSYISFWARSSSTTLHDTYFAVGQAPMNISTDDAIFLYFTAGGVIQVCGSGCGGPSVAYTANTWYFIEFRNINFTTWTFDFYLDGAFVATTSFRNNIATWDTLILYNFSVSDSYYDEIIMY